LLHLDTRAILIVVISIDIFSNKILYLQPHTIDDVNLITMVSTIMNKQDRHIFTNLWQRPLKQLLGSINYKFKILDFKYRHDFAVREYQ
jgi:hypothetical protein